MRPFDKTDKRLGLFLILGLCLLLTGLLTACSSAWTDSVLPATRDYAQQVAQDNAASATAGNPISMLLTGLGTLVSSIAGAGILLRRFDNKPFVAADGTKMTEGELVTIAQQAKASKRIPEVTGTPTTGGANTGLPGDNAQPTV